MPLIQEGEDVEPILTKLRTEVRKGQSLQECCQHLMDAFQESMPQTITLARTYATLPFELLPEPDQTYLRTKMNESQLGDLLRDDTRVLSLLGTAGSRPEWGGRYRSQNHLAIPLLSEASTARMPMVSNMIQQLGRSANWYRRVGGASLQKEPFGVFSDTFFVPDAPTSVDTSGRLMIPDQAFVKDNHVRTVLGVGGEFSREGIIVVSIFFTTERLTGTPKWLLRVPLLLAAIVNPLVADNRIFSE